MPELATNVTTWLSRRRPSPACRHVAQRPRAHGRSRLRTDGARALRRGDGAAEQLDARPDRYFRVFANHRYTHIDPAVAQDDLTELVEPDCEQPFILHPGQFVLGSTLKVISLGDDLAARLEGQALALGTEVPTPAGWTTMERLAIGDRVFDEGGVPRSSSPRPRPWMTGPATRCRSRTAAAS